MLSNNYPMDLDFLYSVVEKTYTDDDLIELYIPKSGESVDFMGTGVLVHFKYNNLGGPTIAAGIAYRQNPHNVSCDVIKLSRGQYLNAIAQCMRFCESSMVDS